MSVKPTPLSTDPFFELVAGLDAVVYLVDPDSYEILYANQTATDLFGNIEGRICWQVFQTDQTRPCPECPRKDELIRTGSARPAISLQVFFSANRQFYTVRTMALTMPNGRPVRLQVALDKHGQAAGCKCLQEEKFKTVADFTYDLETWIREDGTLEYISPSCERITGYRSDEFLHDPELFRSIIDPRDRDLLGHHLREHFTSGQPLHIEFRIIDRKGAVQWISHYCQPVIRDGVFRGRRASNRTITKEKEAEQKMRLTELRLSTLLKLYEKKKLPPKELCDFVLESSLPLTSSPIGFLGFVNEEQTVMSIHAWSKTVMEECAVHKNPLEFKIHEAGLWGEAIRQRKPFLVNDYGAASPFKKGIPAGHIGITRFLAVPVLHNNSVTAVLVVGNKPSDYTADDTDQVLLLLEGMWQIILRREAELELVNYAMDVKKFANAAAHDLKNPAISAYGFARLLKEKYAHVLDEKGLFYCTQIMRSTEHISELAGDINNYISSHDSGWDFENLDLTELWETIRQEFQPQLDTRKVKWLEPEIDRIVFRGNRVALLRVLRNLVDNALKYGGEQLDKIVMGYDASNEHHILTVENNGETIPPEDVEVIFREFKRKAHTPEVYGSGLGLAIVKEIAQKHGGSSWLAANDQGKPVFYISISRRL